ncbi:MAG TPA: POTRA domain-containing protein, partial [Polyangiaceae bacterium]|nr:POTRA domain-containing protein [Polyangiaceae bacterium]
MRPVLVRASFRSLPFFALAAIAMGCASIPSRRAAVDSVKVRGAKQVSASDVEEKLATEPSPKFLGLFRGVVYDYELFNRATLQRDLARVERFYQARGYYEARATAGLVKRVDPKHVEIDIEVDEGVPVVNHELRIEGVEKLPREIALAAERAARDNLPDGEPFDEESFAKAEERLVTALTDRGYAYAKAKRDALIDVVTHRAVAVFAVTPGPPAKFGKIAIQGQSAGSDAPVPLELPEAPLRRAIDIEEGEPYSTADIQTATQALLDLGVFASVDIVPDLPETP